MVVDPVVTTISVLRHLRYPNLGKLGPVLGAEPGDLASGLERVQRERKRAGHRPREPRAEPRYHALERREAHTAVIVAGRVRRRMRSGVLDLTRRSTRRGGNSKGELGRAKRVHLTGKGWRVRDRIPSMMTMTRDVVNKKSLPL